MTKELKIARKYFDLSNQSNFVEISKLFSKTTTYSSQNTGIYLGVNDIINMQKEFHESFSELQWKINDINEIKPGIVVFDYSFFGTKNSGEKVSSIGTEYVIVADGKIQHIEIRNKN